jgi:hypothetical protein
MKNWPEEHRAVKPGNAPRLPETPSDDDIDLNDEDTDTVDEHPVATERHPHFGAQPEGSAVARSTS